MPSGIYATPGARASDLWLTMLGLRANGRWHVEISLVAGLDSALDLNVYAEEWGFAFHHAGRSSWIRVTDIPFVHGRDDHELIRRTPDLAELGTLLAMLEHEHGITFRRANASVRTNVPGALEAVRAWLVSATAAT